VDATKKVEYGLLIKKQSLELAQAHSKFIAEYGGKGDNASLAFMFLKIAELNVNLAALVTGFDSLAKLLGGNATNKQSVNETSVDKLDS